MLEVLFLCQGEKHECHNTKCTDPQSLLQQTHNTRCNRYRSCRHRSIGSPSTALHPCFSLHSKKSFSFSCVFSSSTENTHSLSPSPTRNKHNRTSVSSTFGRRLRSLTSILSTSTGRIPLSPAATRRRTRRTIPSSAFTSGDVSRNSSCAEATANTASNTDDG